MERHRFEAPTKSNWPLMLGTTVLVIAAGLGAWWWLAAPDGPGAITEGELMSGEAANPSPRTPAGSPQEATVPLAGESAPVAPVEATPAVPENPEIAAGGLAEAPEEAEEAEEVTLESLLAQADEAFDAGDLFVALPLYKEVAVRLQLQLNMSEDPSEREALEARLEEIKGFVRESEVGLREASPTPVPDLATRQPHAPAVPGQVRDFTIAGLGNFPYDDEVGGVPPDVEALDGSLVRLTGYMLPAFQTDQIKQFTLVADVYECCFGQPPGVEHMITVDLPEGRSVTFTYGEIQVTGTLRVEEERRDGYVVNLFTIKDVTSVRATGRP